MARTMTDKHLGAVTSDNGKHGSAAIANFFGVSRKTIIRWKKQGAPIYIIGCKYQCNYEEILDWLKENQATLY